jgi:hypothetical protein
MLENKSKVVETSICSCGNIKKSGTMACPDCILDMEYRYLVLQKNDYHTMFGREVLTFEEFLAKFEEDGITDCGECAICGKRYTFNGHNPYPVIDDEDARCCTRCNDEYVSPTRLERLFTNR